MNKKYRYLFLFLLIFVPLSAVLADTLTNQPDETNSFDNFLSSFGPTVNYGTFSNVYIGENNTVVGIYRSIFKFDLSSIPPNAVISSAIMSLYISADYSDNASTFNCYRLKVNASESQSTWNIYSTGNNWQSNGFGSNDVDTSAITTGTSFTSSDAVSLKKDFTFTTSEFVKFVNGTYTNYGWLCRSASENNDMYEFHSSSSGSTSLRPILAVNYSVPTATPTSTVTSTFTVTPTFSQTPTITNTPVFTSTITLTPTVSNTPGFTATFTSTPLIPTNTPVEVISDVEDLFNINMNAGSINLSTGGLVIILLVLFSATYLWKKIQD